MALGNMVLGILAMGFKSHWSLWQWVICQFGYHGIGFFRVDSCQHLFVDSELERVRHKVFDYEKDNLNAQIVDEKLDNSFNSLKCAAKVKLTFEFILKKLEGGGFRFFYAHKNNTLLDQFKLVCTRDNLAKLKYFSTKLTLWGLVAVKE